MRQAVLMSEVEVYGSPIWSSSGYDTGIAKVQLPLFVNSRRAMNSRTSWYCLKDVASSSRFCVCNDTGSAYYSGAGNTWNGVRPRFILSQQPLTTLYKEFNEMFGGNYYGKRI